jgi:hypothetical protein
MSQTICRLHRFVFHTKWLKRPASVRTEASKRSHIDYRVHPQSSGKLRIVSQPLKMRSGRLCTFNTGHEYTKDFKCPHKKFQAGYFTRARRPRRVSNSTYLTNSTITIQKLESSDTEKRRNSIVLKVCGLSAHQWYNFQQHRQFFFSKKALLFGLVRRERSA